MANISNLSPIRFRCKSHKNSTKFCRGNILISYIIPSETSIIKPFSKVRIYKSVLDKVKRNIQVENIPTRASFQIEKKFGSLENIPNQSLVPRGSQAFEENHKRKQETTREPFETASNQAKRRKSDKASYN